MVMLTDLAVAARRSGLPVNEQPGWQTRGHGGMAGTPRSIALHHTAGPRTGEAPSLRVVRDGRSDLPGPLAHFVLGRSGTVYVVAAGQCWHAGATWTANQSNPWAIGIEAEATGVDPWPPGQYDAYLRLVRALCDHYRIPFAAVQGHKEICKPRGRKSDPNFDCNAFRAALGRVSGAPAPAPSAPPAPKVEPVIQNFPIAGTGALELNTPIKGASALYKAAYLSVRSNAGGGKVDIYWGMTGKGGRGEAHWTLNANERRWVELSAADAVDQATVHYALGAGAGAVTVEFAPK